MDLFSPAFNYIDEMFDETLSTPIVQVHDNLIEAQGVELYIKREDQSNQFISGNKYRKLKYNLINAADNGFDTLLTFGGAYSNHIHAVAYAGFKFGFKTIGIIRGEENKPLNPTLKDAASFGMDFHYISREDYRRKSKVDFINRLTEQFGAFYLIPEGGSNSLAVKGCTEIISEDVRRFDHICCACGTGGTIAGIISGLDGENHIWGFPALKNGEFLNKEITDLIHSFNSKTYKNWNLITDFHFGGYAKYTYDLVAFINKFTKKHEIQLDPVYTGKMLYGVIESIKQGFFKRGEKILAIHTGGLQGIRGFNERFGKLIC